MKAIKLAYKKHFEKKLPEINFKVRKPKEMSLFERLSRNKTDLKFNNERGKAHSHRSGRLMNESLVGHTNWTPSF